MLTRAFQSTHPHGVRLDREKKLTPSVVVSIHAPTRGATKVGEHRYAEALVSIHAPTRGATVLSVSKVCFILFQSTHPHGVRRGQARQGRHGGQFQSTHPHGVRHQPKLLLERCLKFQSTHPHGVRRRNHYYVSVELCFNPRTHTGCD